MQPKIFIVGASGYIGGQTLLHLSKSHPEYDIKILARTEAQGLIIKAAFPRISFVVGDLDSIQVLEAAASTADVVLQLASADHEIGAAALISGIKQRPSTSRPGYYIHTGGTGILGNATKDGYGNHSNKVYDDVADVKEITSLPLTHWHREVDAVVLAGSEGPGGEKVKTAIICPCNIYGIGEGPIRTRSTQVPILANSTLRRGKGFTVNKGENIWHSIHVADLADAYVLLTEEALKESGGRATWGPEGYYFVEDGSLTFKTIAQYIATYAYEAGHIKTSEIDELAPEECNRINPLPGGASLWGLNSRGTASRIRALGWEPRRPTLQDCIGEAVEFEVKEMRGQQ